MSSNPEQQGEVSGESEKNQKIQFENQLVESKEKQEERKQIQDTIVRKFPYIAEQFKHDQKQLESIYGEFMTDRKYAAAREKMRQNDHNKETILIAAFEDFIAEKYPRLVDAADSGNFENVIKATAEVGRDLTKSIDQKPITINVNATLQETISQADELQKTQIEKAHEQRGNEFPETIAKIKDVQSQLHLRHSIIVNRKIRKETGLTHEETAMLQKTLNKIKEPNKGNIENAWKLWQSWKKNPQKYGLTSEEINILEKTSLSKNQFASYLSLVSYNDYLGSTRDSLFAANGALQLPEGLTPDNYESLINYAQTYFEEGFHNAQNIYQQYDEIASQTDEQNTVLYELSYSSNPAIPPELKQETSQLEQITQTYGIKMTIDNMASDKLVGHIEHEEFTKGVTIKNGIIEVKDPNNVEKNGTVKIALTSDENTADAFRNIILDANYAEIIRKIEHGELSKDILPHIPDMQNLQFVKKLRESASNQLLNFLFPKTEIDQTELSKNLSMDNQKRLVDLIVYLATPNEKYDTLQKRVLHLSAYVREKGTKPLEEKIKTGM